MFFAIAPLRSRARAMAASLLRRQLVEIAHGIHAGTSASTRTRAPQMWGTPVPCDAQVRISGPRPPFVVCAGRGSFPRWWIYARMGSSASVIRRGGIPRAAHWRCCSHASRGRRQSPRLRRPRALEYHWCGEGLLSALMRPLCGRAQLLLVWEGAPLRADETSTRMGSVPLV